MWADMRLVTCAANKPPNPHRILVNFLIAKPDNLEFLAHHYDQRHRSKMKYIHSEETLTVPEGGEYIQFQTAKVEEGATDEIYEIAIGGGRPAQKRHQY